MKKTTIILAGLAALCGTLFFLKMLIHGSNIEIGVSVLIWFECIKWLEKELKLN